MFSTFVTYISCSSGTFSKCPAERKAGAVGGKFVATFFLKEHPIHEETHINAIHFVLWLFIDLILPDFQV